MLYQLSYVGTPKPFTVQTLQNPALEQGAAHYIGLAVSVSIHQAVILSLPFTLAGVRSRIGQFSYSTAGRFAVVDSLVPGAGLSHDSISQESDRRIPD